MMKSVAPVPLPLDNKKTKPIFHTHNFTLQVNSLRDLQKYDWTSNEQSAQEFLDCIVNIMTYNGCYTPNCLQILVQGFIPKKNKTGDFDLDFSDKISHLIHNTLQKIMTLIPLSTPLIGIALKDEFPHKRYNSEELFGYLKNLLDVCRYAPALIESLLSTAVDHLLQIDVDIELEEVPDREEELQFEVELPDKPAESELTARKLDSMMLIMFEFLDSAFGNVDNEARENIFPSMNFTSTDKQHLFNMLLQIFDKYILSTYKSKYTQYLLFYVCRLKPEEDDSFSARFMAYLFNKIQVKGNRNAHQLASAAYLGSFLARSNYIPASTLREVVSFIMNWTLSYLNNQTVGTPDAVVHGLFYSMSQSLYYIFCFRHEVLLGHDNDALRKGYKRITESKFNPLKFCLPTVVREFVRICTEIGWYDYSELVKNNDKLVLATTSTFGGANQLEMFFPFDPYLLKYSAKYINDYYVSWSAPGDDEDEDDGAFADDSSDSSSSDDDDDDDDDGDEEEGKESSDIDQLTNDFMHFTPDVERDIKYHFSFD